MKVLITGAEGQLGREMQRCAPVGVNCAALGRTQLDITDGTAVQATVSKEQPSLIYNCAAYTAVDGAESKPDLALAINAEAVGHLAKAAASVDARVIHVSTDFVFDGSASTPYRVDHDTRPLGVYGHSKLAGEMRLQEILPMRSAIVRTAWLYSALGANFVKTMLRLMAERTELGVVADQVGAPTWAGGLAEALWALAEHPEAHGIFHWTDAGSCSWHEFALAIQEQGFKQGLLSDRIPVEGISTEDYPTPAARPAYSVLDCSRLEGLLGMQRQNWQTHLHSMMSELA